MTRSTRWQGFPVAFLGYGFLYAWGYVSWCTGSLATQSVSGGTYDFSWLVSATVVPLALVCLALAGTRVDLENARPLYAAAPVLAALGTVLSVAYQHVAHPFAASCMAVASGMLTGGASALFGLLWSLALSRLNTPALELAVPLSFCASALCALIAPMLAQIPALVVALLLVALCGGALARCHGMLGKGLIEPRWLEEAPCGGRGGVGAESTPNIVRMLAFGVVAWTVMNVSPAFAENNAPVAGIDATGALGYALSVVLALGIVRFAVRVDFQALALITLPLLAVSMTLLAFGGGVATFWAGTINVALNSCCEIVLLLYFVRIAQSRPRRRAFWLAAGSAASYLGVLLGQLGSIACARLGIMDDSPALFCLLVVCIYTVAMPLVPQRFYDVVRGMGPKRAAATRTEGTSLAAGVSAANGVKTEWRGGDARYPEGGAGGRLLADIDGFSAACDLVAEEFALSAREAEVCSYLARGRSQTYIRDTLFLSKNTVATHTRRLYAKLGVHSKQELIDLVEAHRPSLPGHAGERRASEEDGQARPRG